MLKTFVDNYDTGILSPVSQRTAPHHHHHHHRPAHGSSNAHSALAPPSPHHQRANSSGGTTIDSNDTSTGSIKTCHQEAVLESSNLTKFVENNFNSFSSVIFPSIVLLQSDIFMKHVHNFSFQKHKILIFY
jgi:hypothetical protein